jgi:hypothetical protein
MALIPEILTALAELLVWIGGGLWWDVPEEPRPTGRIERGDVTSARRMESSCAYCRRKGGLFLACRACRAPHHADCARLNGRCAVYACGGNEFRAPAA